jgi:serpin B
MLLAGDKGKSAKEIKNVLELGSFELYSDIHTAYQEIKKSISIKLDDTEQLFICNVMCLNIPVPSTKCEDVHGISTKLKNVRLHGNPFNTSYKNSSYLELLLQPHNFLMQNTSNPVEAILVNISLFRGEWDFQFKLDNNTDEVFFLDERYAITIRLMHLSQNKCDYFKFVKDDNLKSSIVELPYKGWKYSMFVVLPYEVNGLKDMGEALTTKNLTSAIERMKCKRVNLKLPKFTIGSISFLDLILSNMGMPEVFSKWTMDLSGTNDNVGEKKIINPPINQITYLIIEESAPLSNENADDGAWKRKNTQGYPNFIANHPFIIFIRDNYSGCILFWGRVNNPDPEAKVFLYKKRKRVNNMGKKNVKR